MPVSGGLTTQTMTNERVEPRIYVACLAAYNSGTLHGEWIDAAQNVEDIRAEIETMLAESPEPGAEEYAIHDFENFGALELHAHEDLEHIAQAARLIARYGEFATLVLDHFGGLEFLEDATEALKDHIVGYFDDHTDWARYHLEETGLLKRVPESLRPYLDLPRYARDMELSGDFVVLRESEGARILVLWNH